MSVELSPYRNMDAIVKKPGPSRGLIRAKAPKKPHKHSLPGFWKFFFSWLRRDPIYKYSVYRCSCNKIFGLYSDDDWISPRWYHDDIEGPLEKQLRWEDIYERHQ